MVQSMRCGLRICSPSLTVFLTVLSVMQKVMVTRAVEALPVKNPLVLVQVATESLLTATSFPSVTQEM